jgi:nucleoside-diphosphate-sugar epimerase
LAATEGVSVIIHLAASVGEDDFSESYKNSVVTTRNLLDAVLAHGRLVRFVNVSSMSVYSNCGTPKPRLLDESCPVESHPERRGDPYCFAKLKQDELITQYATQYGLSYVLIRPGYVYGPGKDAMNGLIGTGTFGLFLHLGGSNKVPFTYVDNCSDAIVSAALAPGIEGEVFNVVDDDLISSRRFLQLYKKHVRSFPSVYIPHALSYLLCYLWERYSEWSEGQLPPAFNRLRWHFYWKRTHYTNIKLKTRTGWKPRVSTADGLSRYFASCRDGERYA